MAEIVGAYIGIRRKQIAEPKNLEWRASRLARVLGPIRVSSVTADLGRRYIAARAKEGVGTATSGDELALLNAALRWAAAEDMIAPIPPLKLPPRPPPRERWLTPAEVSSLVDACKERHVRLFIILMLATAARPGAILELQWSQVDLERGRVHLNPAGRRQTAKRRATVPLSTRAILELRTAREKARTGRVIEYHGKPVGAIKQAFWRAAQRAGLSSVTPKTLRHTAATWLAQDRVPMWRVAGMLGHTSSRTTERTYAKHSPDYLEDAADALDARLGTVMGQK